MGRKIGYARVSNIEQNLDLQLKALKAAGCVEVFTDNVTGARADRPGLNKCLARLKRGDTLYTWRLDRLGKSMPQLVSVIQELKKRAVGFSSLQDEAIDTTTASGELVFKIFASLEKFERELVRERTSKGLTAARARGKLGGRHPVPIDDPTVRLAKKMSKDHSISITKICAKLKISRATYYRYISMNESNRST